MTWQAKWIWVAGCSEKPNCYVYARRQFDLENIANASLCIACSSEYKAYINGRYVGRGMAHCGRSYHPFDRYDVSHYLRPGPNVIGLICHNRGVDTASGPAKTGGVLAQIDLADLDEPLVATDEHWRVSPARELNPDSPRISHALGFQEIYDSRLKPVGWNVVGFDDSAWQTPEILGEAFHDRWGSIVPRTIPSLSETQLLPVEVIVHESDAVRYPRSLLNPSGDYATITPGKDRAIVLDFGRDVVGFPGFSVLDGGLASVDIGYSTVLQADGTVAPAQSGISQADRVILHGGRQEWQAFGRRAFRYVQLTFRDVRSPILLRGVTASGIGYPIKRSWEFECSDDSLNAAYEAGAESLALCMQDIYECDPLGDQPSSPTEARLLALANYHTYGDTSLAASDIRRFARDIAQRESRFAPSQLLDWILMLHEYYLHSGDLSVVEGVYPLVHQVLDECARLVDPGAAFNALHYQALRDASKLALAITAFDDAKVWHEQSNAVDQRFRDPAESSYESPEADVMAVACGIAGARKNEIVKADIVERAPNLPPEMLYHTLQALVRLDLPDEALALIRSRHDLSSSLPAWHRAIPAQFLASEALGIKAYKVEELGIIIQPHLGGMEWVRGGLAARLGVECRRTPDELSLEIDGPEGCVVAIPVDGFVSPVVHEIDLTPDTPQRRARKTYGWGDVIWRGGEERDPYLDWLDRQGSEPPEDYRPRNRCEIGGGYVWVRETVSTHVRYVVHEG